MRGHILDWIWNVRGSLPLHPRLTEDEAFARLDPLFSEKGTSHARQGYMLAFEKKGQGAQDKMSIFDAGILHIRRSAAGLVLDYRLKSRALLYCFLAPLLFLAFAQATILIGTFEQEKATETQAAKKKKKDVALPQHPIDAFLGAPAPEKPKSDKEKAKDEDKPSPTPAYVFAGLFAALYIVGRILEDRLVKSLFRKRLVGG